VPLLRKCGPELSWKRGIAKEVAFGNLESGDKINAFLIDKLLKGSE
jgi:hypothetical protein